MPRYLLYARKSSESEDRQALSIDSQIRELTEYAKHRDLEVTGVLSESRSAKTPGRPVFGELMRRLTKHEASGILCWKLDRLARNPIDGGALIWALDQGAIEEIAVPGKSFSNRGDDKFWMQLEFGMAKKYVDDLSDNVLRGNRAKLEHGWLPGLPPLGYLNDRSNRTIIADPDRFPLVQKIWRMILAGEAPARVFESARNQSGLSTRIRGRRGGIPLVRSVFYRMLSNPFYYGLLLRSGESFPGSHPAMVTKEEFDRVQEVLRRPNRVPRKRRLFAFTGLITCGECGASITAEEQVNRYGYRYNYYHCTKRKTGVSCSQKRIRAERLEAQLVESLGRITIPDSYRDWALRQLSVIASDEAAEKASALVSLERAHAAARRKATELLELRLRGLLTDEEFIEKKAEVVASELRHKHQLEGAKAAREPIWFEPSRNAIIFANLAPKRFATASVAEKRDILRTLGSNLTLTDQILRIQAETPFVLEEETTAIPTWYTRRNAHLILQGWKVWFSEHPTRVQWPTFCQEWWEKWKDTQKGVRTKRSAAPVSGAA